MSENKPKITFGDENTTIDVKSPPFDRKAMSDAIGESITESFKTVADQSCQATIRMNTAVSAKEIADAIQKTTGASQIIPSGIITTGVSGFTGGVPGGQQYATVGSYNTTSGHDHSECERRLREQLIDAQVEALNLRKRLKAAEDLVLQLAGTDKPTVVKAIDAVIKATERLAKREAQRHERISDSGGMVKTHDGWTWSPRRHDDPFGMGKTDCF